MAGRQKFGWFVFDIDKQFLQTLPMQHQQPDNDETNSNNNNNNDHEQYSSLIRECNEKFNLLYVDGKMTNATSERIDIKQVPSFFDEQLFLKCQQVCQKYYTNLSLASFSGLLMLVQVPEILAPLLATGKSLTVSALYDRYTATARYIRSFYEDPNFYLPDSTSNSNSNCNAACNDGRKNLLLVRSMHQRIHKLMNGHDGSNNSVSRNKDTVWVNQYDMALTQFAFAGLFLLEPKQFGAHLPPADANELLLSVGYFWRVLSYYFGIENQYNLFEFARFSSNEDSSNAAACYRNNELNYNKLVMFMNGILNHYNLNLLHNTKRHNEGTRMARGIVCAHESLLSKASFEYFDYLNRKLTSLSGLSQIELASSLKLKDRYKYKEFRFITQFVMKSPSLHRYLTQKYRSKFDKFCKDSEKIKAKLDKKYFNLTFDNKLD